MSQCKLISCNKHTTVLRNVDNEGGCLWREKMCGKFVPFAQFCCEPETSLNKSKDLKTKQKQKFPGCVLIVEHNCSSGLIDLVEPVAGPSVQVHQFIESTPYLWRNKPWSDWGGMVAEHLLTAGFPAHPSFLHWARSMCQAQAWHLTRSLENRVSAHTGMTQLCVSCYWKQCKIVSINTDKKWILRIRKKLYQIP
jgi:hypothetical protein